MGPRLGRRGWLAEGALEKLDLLLQWGRAWVGADGPPAHRRDGQAYCFNGAAPGSARTADGRIFFKDYQYKLQWGRAWVGADRPRVISACCKTQWRCVREGWEQRMGGASFSIAPVRLQLFTCQRV